MMLHVGVQHATRVTWLQAGGRRVGYPLFPSLGGTFHSFTGTPLDAAVVDVLPLTKRVDAKQVPPAYPEQCDAYTCCRTNPLTLRYVGLSCVRRADDLVLAQALNPQLFRQGPQIGPDVFTRMLRGDLASREASAEWTRLEKAARGRARASTSMPLPCAFCSKDQPQELFAVPPPDVHRRSTTWYPVEVLLPMGYWRACVGCRSVCNTAAQGLTGSGADAVRAAKAANAATAMLRCAVCTKDMSSNNFLSTNLRRWIEAVCITCDPKSLRAANSAADAADEQTWTCSLCNAEKTAEHLDMRDMRRLKKSRSDEQT